MFRPHHLRTANATQYVMEGGVAFHSTEGGITKGGNHSPILFTLRGNGIRERLLRQLITILFCFIYREGRIEEQF